MTGDCVKLLHQILENHKLPLVTCSNKLETSEHLARTLARSALTELGDRRRPSKVGKLQFGVFSFFLIEFGTSMHMEAEVDLNHFIIMVCLRGSADLHIDGQPIRLDAGCAFLAQPCRTVVGNFSSDCVRLMIRIEPKVMSFIRHRNAGNVISAVDVRMGSWFEQVQLILSSPPLMSILVGNRAISLQMEAMLISLLKFEWFDREESRGSQQIVSRDVRRAEAFIRTNGHDCVRLEDLVSASGVSARTLQNNFIKFRGQTPMRFLRNTRLQMARQRLLDDGNDVSITDLAFESGFNHLGRFSLFYRERYGESPSETLRQRMRSRHIPRSGADFTPSSRLA